MNWCDICLVFCTMILVAAFSYMGGVYGACHVQTASVSQATICADKSMSAIIRGEYYVHPRR